MENYISLFILIPFLGFFATAVVPNRDEIRLSQISFSMLGLQFISVLVFTANWIWKGGNPIYKKQLNLLHFDSFTLYIDFVYNGITATFLLVGAFIAFLITAFSRNYLHREEGFKRFFTTILFFYLGYNFIVLSGNLTTIFIGWEIAGISSFLLIAYYRDRFIPVKNAIKIFSIYRLGDVALILAMWFSHQIWHDNISLYAYKNMELVTEHISHYMGFSIGFALCIIVAASIKSALFPFSALLPRAMEGPTPSSAIFYSSLAVHLGVVVLLRTYNFWIHVPYMQGLVIALGALSFVFSSITARIQPSVKGQIAYLTIAQVGLMVIEVALGWHVLALIHFASHAMLRSYQLLISPSIVSYAIKDQFFNFSPIKRIRVHPIMQNFTNSMYILSLNEWYLDSFIYYLVWAPFKNIGLLLHKIPGNWMRKFSVVALTITGILTLLIKFQVLNLNPFALATCLLGLALIYIIRVFTYRERVIYTWHEIACYHLLLMAAVYVNGLNLYYLSYYLGGIVLSYFLGHFALNNIRKKEQHINLHGYQGHCYEYPITEFFFLLSCLGLIGFPITSAFLGMELITNNITASNCLLLVLLLLCFLVNGLAMIRIYARIFLGPHIKTYHSSARKSS